MTSKIILVTMLLLATRSRWGICLPMDTEVGRQADPLPFPSWPGEDFPNPFTEPEKCRQSKSSSICDPEKDLTTNEATKLNDLIQRIRNTSPCLCQEDCATDASKKGLVIGVAVMGELKHPYHIEKTEYASNVTNKIKEKWNMGSCGNDILILLAEKGHVVSYVPGKAVVNFLSVETIQDIFTQCQGYFESGNYYEGLESVINSLYNILQNTVQKAQAPNEDKEMNAKSGNIGLTVGLVVGCACVVGFVIAGVLIVRRKRLNNNQDRFMFDSPNGRNIKREDIGPIAKMPVVFPDAVYQPCSIEDSKKGKHTVRETGSDDDEEMNNEDLFSQNLEENPAYESADLLSKARAAMNAEGAIEKQSTKDHVGVHFPRRNDDYKNARA